MPLPKPLAPCASNILVGATLASSKNSGSRSSADLLLAGIAIVLLALPMPLLIATGERAMVKAAVLAAILLPPAAMLLWAHLRLGPKPDSRVAIVTERPR